MGIMHARAGFIPGASSSSLELLQLRAAADGAGLASKAPGCKSAQGSHCSSALLHRAGGRGAAVVQSSVGRGL